MENPNSFPAPSRLKRKSDDSEAVLELLHGVSISPHSKRLRQEFGYTSHFKEIAPSSGGFLAPELDLCDQLPTEMLSAPPDVDLSEQLSDPLPAPVNDERAIVLYKPVNPPLFPGGPHAGSQLLLNASILQSGVLDASNVLRIRKEDDLPWLSAQRSGVKIVDLSEEQGDNRENHLAVVPWDSSSLMNMRASQAVVQPLSGDIEGMVGDDENLGVEAMEEDNEIRMGFVNSQPSNSNTSFFYEPWQQYGAPPQPQYSSLMWSH